MLRQLRQGRLSNRRGPGAAPLSRRQRFASTLMPTESRCPKGCDAWRLRTVCSKSRQWPALMLHRQARWYASQCASLLSAAAKAVSRTTREAGIPGIEYCVAVLLQNCLPDAREQPAPRRRSICHEIHAQLWEATCRALEEDVGRVLVSQLAESTGQERSAREIMLR